MMMHRKSWFFPIVCSVRSRDHCLANSKIFIDRLKLDSILLNLDAEPLTFH
jgi:hypothetical protein